ncbi:hypothetical protein LM596_00345 [Liquorilactobacillus mali]|uniref:polysaccharide biosynthesis C-terminal domain-containing protein n=2 Tax=Liquorilactobacillus mali TaxID=1618 RepID=UPI0009770449|nr:hypothetical protein LM596_00345 [Liquorilactobacillus mali]
MWGIKNQINFKNIFINIPKYMIAGIIMFIPVLKINTSVKINILSLFLEVLLGIILYFVSLLVLKPTNLKEIKKFLNEFTKNLLNSTKKIILF